MAFNYSESVVLWSYHENNPSNYSPTISQLNKWDRDLFANYEDKLIELLNEYEIPVSRETKSRVLLLATFSNGGTVAIKVRNACKYYAHAWSLNLDANG